MYPLASSVASACERFLEIADTGHVFSHDDLFGDPATAGVVNDQSIGFGHTLVGRDLALLGSDNGATVFVTVVKLDDERLYLETELEWAEGGARHASSARYILWSADFQALQMAANDYACLPPWRQVLSLARTQRQVRRPGSRRFADETERYGVKFVQTYPGCDSETNDLERLTRQKDHERAVTIAIRKHHFLAMLSPDEYGFVLPGILPKLLAWVEE